MTAPAPAIKTVFICMDCAHYAAGPYNTPDDLATLIEGRSNGEIAFVRLAGRDPAPRHWACDMCLRPDARVLQEAWLDLGFNG